MILKDPSPGTKIVISRNTIVISATNLKANHGNH